MTERGRLRVGSDSKVEVEVRYSPWRHAIFVTFDGVPIRELLTWKSPGGQWSVPVPSAPEHALVIDVRCLNEKIHYPHAHVLEASWGDEHLRLAADWLERAAPAAELRAT